jgi:uncharacterized protein
MPTESIANALLEILACPVCLASVRPVTHPDQSAGLQCPVCARIYPIRHGIPVMLVDEASNPSA